MFVTHLECSLTGERYEAGRPHNLSKAGKPLLVRYDLDAVARALTKDKLAGREPGMWKWRELLPMPEGCEPVSLGEPETPIIPLTKTGGPNLLVKDEGRLPTGSFKARGLGMAVTKARTLGVKGLMIPSAGNAGGAAAVYGARAGVPVAVVVPRGTPEAAVAEAIIAGAYVFTVDGSIATAGRLIARVAPALGWFDLATLKEPYRLEGKKTMGLELAEQLDWDTPDVLMYPTGGGTGLVGIWKAYEELAAMGWVKSPPPRFVAVQAEGCAPVVKAWEDKAETTAMWENPVTHAAGLRVPGPFAGRQMLRILRESGGTAQAVSEDEIIAAQHLLGRLEGIWTAPESAAALAALLRLRAMGEVGPRERVVIMLTGCGFKYPAPPLPAPVHLEGSESAILDAVRRAIGA